MPYLFDKFRNGIDRLTGLADVEEVLAGLSRSLKKTVRNRWSVVYLLDRDQGDFAPGRSSDLPPELLPLFRDPPLVPGNRQLLKVMLRRKKPLLITDAAAWDLLTPELRPLL